MMNIRQYVVDIPNLGRSIQCFANYYNTFELVFHVVQVRGHFIINLIFDTSRLFNKTIVFVEQVRNVCPQVKVRSDIAVHQCLTRLNQHSPRSCTNATMKPVQWGMLPHLPINCMVMGSSPHLLNVLATVIRKVWSEILQFPLSSFEDPPGRSTARLVVSTTLSLEHASPCTVGNNAVSLSPNVPFKCSTCLRRMCVTHGRPLSHKKCQVLVHPIHLRDGQSQ